MPVRCLEYIARLYEQLYKSKEKYSRKQLAIPTPEFFVFYNGKQPYNIRRLTCICGLSAMSALNRVLGFYYSFVQSSTFSPGILENSLILFVTTVRFRAKP